MEIGFRDGDDEDFRASLRSYTDAELLARGKLLHEVVFPGGWRPTNPLWVERLKLAREEWRRRHLKDTATS